MSDLSRGTFFELILYGISFFGGLFHWLFFLGKKPFLKVLENRFINGLIRISVMILLFFLFKKEIYELLLLFINNRLNRH